jgi:hypothetical protein
VTHHYATSHPPLRLMLIEASGYTGTFRNGAFIGSFSL